MSMTNSELRATAMGLARAFVEKHVAPVAAELDEKEEFPLSNFRELGRLGLLGLQYPEDDGGAGLGVEAYVGLVRELARSCASTAMTVVAHAGLVCHPLHAYGTPTQKRTHLAPLLSGEKIGAFCLTEPESGSDISAMRSEARPDGDGFVLDGNKVFITNANVADVFVVAAKTAPALGMLGISLFVLDRGMEGLSVTGRKERKLGMCASDTGELVFDGVRVGRDRLLGRANSGFRILHETLTCARLGMAAIALGIAEGAQAHCIAHVTQRRQFGKPLCHFQSIKNMLADMETGIRASALLLLSAAELKDRGADVTMEASIAKLFASETAVKVTKDAVQIFGASGYSRDYPLERFYRDAKLTEIGDGTSEIQRLIIADEVVKRGRPRSGAAAGARRGEGER